MLRTSSMRYMARLQHFSCFPISYGLGKCVKNGWNSCMVSLKYNGNKLLFSPLKFGEMIYRSHHFRKIFLGLLSSVNDVQSISLLVNWFLGAKYLYFMTLNFMKFEPNQNANIQSFGNFYEIKVILMFGLLIKTLNITIYYLCYKYYIFYD